MFTSLKLVLGVISSSVIYVICGIMQLSNFFNGQLFPSNIHYPYETSV